MLAAVFCLMAVVFYGLTAWLPDVYVERGWSEGSAGGLIAVLNVASLPTTLLVPWLADRYGSRRLYLVAASGLMTVALVGIVLVPGGGVGVGRADRDRDRSAVPARAHPAARRRRPS